MDPTYTTGIQTEGTMQPTKGLTCTVHILIQLKLYIQVVQGLSRYEDPYDVSYTFKKMTSCSTKISANHWDIKHEELILMASAQD